MAEHTLTFTDDSFSSDVLDADQPVLVDFWAPWCGPCRALTPTINDLAETYAGRVKVGKVNVDDNPEVAQQYGVRSIPTLLIIQDGDVVEQIVGAVPKEQLAKKLDAALGQPA
jgi:thioredoxin 1